MVEKKKKAILDKKDFFDDSQCYEKGLRGGIEVEKGVVLTEQYLQRNFDNIGRILSEFSAYPDVFLDLIKPADSNFQLFFYQRIVLRALMRFKDVYIVAPRAFSKSFITILGMMLQCIFMPGTKRFICAPGKGQSAQIAKEKIIEIYDRWPLLRKEVVGGDVSDAPGSFGKDYVTLKFRNGSIFDVVAPLDSTRGGRRQGLKFVFFHQFCRVLINLAYLFLEGNGGFKYDWLYLSHYKLDNATTLYWTNNRYKKKKTTTF